MKKRILALALAILLAAALFAACGGDSASDRDSNDGGDGSLDGGSSSGGGSSYAVGDIIEFGGYDWRVLDVQDGRALILSDLVLEYRGYHNTFAFIIWADSDIRAYLNGEFYDDNFTTDEKARIAETRIMNDDNPWYGIPGGNNTTDRVFLLSLEEVVRYFGDSGQLRNRPPGQEIDIYFEGEWYYDQSTDWTGDDGYADFIYDEYNEARISYDIDGHVAWWWLRSPGDSSTCAAYVENTGFVFVLGNGVDGTAGVRPAMWIEL